MKKTIIITALTLILAASAVLLTAAFGDDDPGLYKIYYDGKSTGFFGYFDKNTPYLPVGMIGKYASNPGITVDTSNLRLEIDISAMNIMMADDDVTNFVKTYAGNAYIPLRKIEDDVYFPLNTTQQFFRLNYSVSGGSINIAAYSGTDKIAVVQGGGASALTSIIAGRGETVPLSTNERVIVTGETDNYYVINISDKGKAYVLKDCLSILDEGAASLDFYAPKKVKWKQGGPKINLAWQYVADVTPEAPSKYGGLDIISPTWFDLITDGDGAVENNGDKGYMDQCRDSGYMVWATITNSMSTKGSTKFTTKVFNTQALLNKSIAQYIFYACLYDVDGINIDYEDVDDNDAPGLVNFTRALRDYTERQGLVLSIDTLIPKPWTIEYDRKNLARYVDYIAVMTYDEHWSTSPQAGSVSSLPWSEQAIKDTISEGVPADKILLGVPLYTRVWCIGANGRIVSSKSATMQFVQDLLAEKNLTPTYLSYEQQNYVEYPDGDTTAKIWIEDNVSIQNRINLVKKYNLAGTACWQFAQGTEDIWSVFEQSL